MNSTQTQLSQSTPASSSGKRKAPTSPDAQEIAAHSDKRQAERRAMLFTICTTCCETADWPVAVLVPDDPDWLPESFEAVWNWKRGCITPYATPIWPHIARLLYWVDYQFTELEDDEIGDILRLPRSERLVAVRKRIADGKRLWVPSLTQQTLAAHMFEPEHHAAPMMRMMALENPEESEGNRCDDATTDYKGNTLYF